MPPRNASEQQHRPLPDSGRHQEPGTPPASDRVTRQLPLDRGTRQSDRVVRTRFASEQPAPVARARQAPALVMPGWRHLVLVAAPDLVAALSFMAAVAVASLAGVASVLFVLPLIIPSLVLGGADRSLFGQGWRSAAAVNLATMLLLFPLLVIRQSAVRVPYLDEAHGTVFAAVISTMAVLVALVGVAAFVAWSARQDPESAPMLLLPAALMVPLLTSATEFARLQTALWVAAMIFAAASALTLLASLLPPRYTVFVAPIAVAAEVLYVTVVRQDRIFPVGVGEAGMTLFATVIISAIGLVVIIPGLSAWMLQVDMRRLHGLSQRRREYAAE